MKNTAMKEILIVIIFLMVKSNAMAQTISLNNNGLSGLELNTNIKDIKGIQYNRIENYPNINKFVYEGGDYDGFKFYYIVSDCQVEGLKGIKKDIFFACDTSGKVRGIFIPLQNATDSVKAIVSRAFGPALLAATSGIGAQENIRQKTYWYNDANKASVFFNQNKHSDISSLEITNRGSDGKAPYLSIRLLYK
jgi:hypothetical protein